MPAVIAPLPPGSYTLQIGDGTKAKITIKEDMQLARKWQNDLLVRLRKGDRFARYVASKYGLPATLIEPLLQDLLSDQFDSANRAAEILQESRELPASAGDVVRKAMAKQIDLVKARKDGKVHILTSLAYLAAKIGTDDQIDTVLMLVRSGIDRANSLGPLANFKQPRATRKLRSLIQDENEDVRIRSAQVLAGRKDEAALGVLLATAHDPKSQWRAYAVKSLVNYPNDPRVEPAIKSRLDDSDSFVRQSAELALRQLANQKKPEP